MLPLLYSGPEPWQIPEQPTVSNDGENMSTKMVHVATATCMHGISESEVM